MINLYNMEGKKEECAKGEGVYIQLPFVCVCTLMNEDTLILNEDALILNEDALILNEDALAYALTSHAIPTIPT
jgi:hypothetical protein